jgi:large subunit ribosomal protein L15
MVIHKRKKNIRQRGSKTHGWGAMKKHRGAGNRGGRGMAGSGKRGDSKKPSIWKNKKYFGMHGFKKKNIKRIIKAVNIIDLEDKFDKWVNNKLIHKDNDFYNLDLTKLGFNKLLGRGKVTKKYKITTEFASKKAIDKIKNLGGEVILKYKNVSME